MALIENLSRTGTSIGGWINLSGGVGNETVTSLGATSATSAPQGIAVRVVLQDGTLAPIINSRLLKTFQSVRLRVPGLVLLPGQYLSCYSSQAVNWTLTMSRVNGGRARTNRISVFPPVNAWQPISVPGSPLEMTSVLCVNKTEAEARVGLRSRNESDGGTSYFFVNEPVPPRSSYRASIPNLAITSAQFLDVFSSSQCAWFISGVNA
jgi:hypothetical protein